MSHHKTKRSSAKPDKLNFFGHKQTPATLATQASTESVDPESDDGMPTSVPGTQSDTTQIMKADLNAAMEIMSNKLITTWQHTADSMRKDIQELGKRTSLMEDKCDEFATAHNDLATTVERVCTEPIACLLTGDTHGHAASRQSASNPKTPAPPVDGTERYIAPRPLLSHKGAHPPQQ
ncbi:Hypothetical predicted protein [Pelobates cultripes]|uniref:Uncharacterized protein n=1 Tax=Pelobates cultripes TaxID=61616 RepID=A0AAD1RDR6_PELCU|nr:Hypothetical predicted protein [Pelobates cultripes]